MTPLNLFTRISLEEDSVYTMLAIAANLAACYIDYVSSVTPVLLDQFECSSVPGAAHACARLTAWAITEMYLDYVSCVGSFMG